MELNRKKSKTHPTYKQLFFIVVHGLYLLTSQRLDDRSFSITMLSSLNSNAIEPYRTHYILVRCNEIERGTANLSGLLFKVL